MFPRKKIVIALALTAVATAAGFTVLGARKAPDEQYKTARVERGDIVASVSATGNLAAVTTVQVGSQVSGTIQKLFADFNSPVKKGQAIARIDPSIFNAQLEQSRGNHLNAQAALEKARATAADAGRTLERNRQLVKDGIVAQSDFDSAETRCQEAAAAVKAAEGGLAQTRGSYSQALTNLRYATIRSPVDGIVVSRSVDMGQTVAASFQTPTLFTIAQDLTRMLIETSVDEADISRVRVGQPATFTVDAYPADRFAGTVTQVRNAPVTVSNVVTYVVVVGVDNKEMRLKPGMTANVTIETARKENVLKIPAAALRFRPKEAKEANSKQAGDSGRVNKEGGQQVCILADNKPRPEPVKTGISNDGQVELAAGGLRENDEVIVEQLLPAKKTNGMGAAPMGPRL